MFAINGNQGPQGEPGPAGADGDGIRIAGWTTNVDSLDDGQMGDIFIDINTGEGYVWTGSSWFNFGPFRGPQGDPRT